MPHLRDVCAASAYVQRVNGLAGGHKEPVPLGAAKTKVGADFGQHNLSDSLAGRREDVDAVVSGAYPPHAGPDIAVHVGANAVGQSRLAVHLVVNELAFIAHLAIGQIEDLYVLGVARITDVDLLIVG